ncbi:hypothetical protein [Oceanibaculum pacificum]|uniref:Uncharacterized protein n=1 Tax=Oceanibaculum pacificum TaxID=580166 RepID=A0A154W5D3_9PROT|nr:hypothetical protein [Oceanibaculum pacificum]KZD08754.1 hypothetical protein AUP43_08310 [Oceanibaculum pacificum]
MRDQYAGDVSDYLKFSLLRALVREQAPLAAEGAADRLLGIAWYYVPGDDGRPDGRHTEYLTDPLWRALDPGLHDGLRSLPARSLAALEAAPIWPEATLFHRIPVPGRKQRQVWHAAKAEFLDTADLLFLDPDNGIAAAGGAAGPKHTSMAEIAALRRTGRCLVIITFPGRRPHAELVDELHHRLRTEAGASAVAALRTNVCVPSAPGENVCFSKLRRTTE